MSNQSQGKTWSVMHQVYALLSWKWSGQAGARSGTSRTGLFKRMGLVPWLGSENESLYL